MNNMMPGGMLSQLAATPHPRGRKPADRSFYTYGAPPRGNSPPVPLPGPGGMPVRPPNFASGGPSAAPGGILAALAGASGAPQRGTLETAGGVKGPGTGRSDEIDAKLSDGEYVLDAETVALLGDGSTDAGVKRLDEMRQRLRSHKGKALAKGKFSPDAKRPDQYLGKE